MTAAEKSCSRCRTRKPLEDFHRHRNARDGRASACRDCVNAARREWEAANREHVRREARRRAPAYRKANAERLRQRYEDNPEQARAWRVLANEIEYGRVVRPDVCSECGGGGRIEGHHPDYSKPLEVVWLCSDCHAELHRLGRAAA